LLWLLLEGRVRGEDRLHAVRTIGARIDAATPEVWARLTEVARAERYVLLGGGAGHRLGEEAALKFIEMGRVPAWAWRALEYGHGPLKALDERTAVVGPLGASLAEVDVSSSPPLQAELVAPPSERERRGRSSPGVSSGRRCW
jgi:hypothetical protein